MKYLLTCFILAVISSKGHSQLFLDYINHSKVTLTQIGNTKRNFKAIDRSDVVILSWMDTTYNCKVNIQIDASTNKPLFVYYLPMDSISCKGFIALLNTKFSSISSNSWEDASNVKLIGMHGYYTCVNKLTNTFTYSFMFTNCSID